MLGKSLPTANCCSQRPDLNIDKGLCLDFCVRTELAGVTTLGHKQRRKKKKKRRVRHSLFSHSSHSKKY